MINRRILLKLQGTLYNLVVTDNLNGDSEAATNASITITYVKDQSTVTLGTTYKNGDTFLIPNGATDITVTGSSITTNGSWATDIQLNGAIYTVIYKATKITMSSSMTTNLSIGNVSSPGSISFTRYIAWDSSWNASADNIISSDETYGTDYIASLNQSSGTANTTSIDITVSWGEIDWEYANGDTADLGLPSGKLWATKNVGASSDTDYGLYFSWGDTTGHTASEKYNFSTDNYNASTSGSGHNLTASFTSGDATYDAATAANSSQRTPTYEEYSELVNKCRWVWTTKNGVKGYRVTGSGSGGPSIFLPAAGYFDGTSHYDAGTYGYYWSARYNNSSIAYFLNFNDSNHDMYNFYGYYGFSVRAIIDPGVYAYYSDGSLSSTGDESAIGVALITKNCSFVIDKTDTKLKFGGYDKDLSNVGVVTDNVEIAKLDFNGEQNTTNIINACEGYTNNNITGAPAAEKCREQFDGKGYLGSFGEVQEVYNNKSAINNMLTAIGGTVISDYLWTSTMNNVLNRTWRLNFNTGGPAGDLRTLDYKVRAFMSL